MPDHPHSPPPGATGVLVTADGTVIWGHGLGAVSQAVGEVCFNTAMTGYQEILTDPSYAAQIITFTFPHIGIVGANAEDVESTTPAARGAVLRCDVTAPSNWRAARSLDDWLKAHDIVALAGVDTRALTRRIRDHGAMNAVIAHDPTGKFDIAALRQQAANWPGLEGMDLAREVSCRQSYRWTETAWQLGQGYGTATGGEAHIVAVDFGVKRNILRSLAARGLRITVVPAQCEAETILAHKPDGVLLTNGPGDPAATASYAVPMIQSLLAADMPIFGICLGHQLLGLALGAQTVKMHHGHRGANHPVKDLATGKVEITSQNHGFAVNGQTLPAGVIQSHISLFDGTNQGLRVENRPIFSVQFHPEASPGPQDSLGLFDRFCDFVRAS